VSKFAGVRQVARFNWPAYAGAAALVAVAMVAPRRVRPPLAALAAGAVWFAAASLVATNLVYDRSEFAGWEWARRLFRRPPRRIAVLHAGLDNASAHVRRLWPDAEVQIVDFYDPTTMTEPAIARARGDLRNGDELGDLRAGLDAAFVVLAAHELRTRPDRAAFFSRIAEALAPAGRLVLIEHLRDLPNAFVYGPGAWHFLPRTDYLVAFEDAELSLREERSMTPFLRQWVLSRSADRKPQHTRPRAGAPNR
jgi:SAM-dependent methyltransferase